MPRGSAASSSSKRHNNSHHQNNNHHANGSLVPPVKRPSRSRSSSNAVVASQSTSSSVTSPHESSPVGQNQQQTSQHQLRQQHSVISDVSTGSSTDLSTDWSMKGDVRGYSDGMGGSNDPSCSNGMDSGRGTEHRKIDIGPATTRSGILSGSTVLPAFPLLDSITLLIIFLNLPSTVLTIVHFLFATLTFVPPTTTLLSASAAASMPSFTTLLLQGSAGSPSILTILLADILVAIISIVIWPSARALLIDFAQAVMAISLGAGNTGHTGGTLKNAAVCAGVISSARVIKNRYDFGDPWFQSDSFSTHQGHGYGFPAVPNNSASWVRNALAVHIVAQGAMRALRGWLIQRPLSPPNFENGSSSLVSSVSSKDDNSPNVKAKDKDPENGSVGSTQSVGFLGMDGGRRKKKQTSVVRSRQPLWATLASTIVHVAKVIEQSQAVSEAVNPSEDGPGDQKVQNLDGRVWISNIGSTDVTFGAGRFTYSVSDEEPSGDSGSQIATTGLSKNGQGAPFFVRVNGIAWPQTDIYKPTEKEEDVESGDGKGAIEEEWMVDVSGLTPATEYDFEFVRTKGGAPFYQTSACTMPAQVASSIAAPPPPPSSRPLSPVTTLLNTLSQANGTLAETKVRLKRTKKENNRKLAALRSEIDTLKSRLGGGDKGEERARRRVLSLREFVRRAEEEVEKMTVELERLESIPEEVEKDWKQKKQLWIKEQDHLAAVKQKVQETKASASRHASAVESEAAQMASKQERLSARLTKLKSEMEKLSAENSAGREVQTRKQNERDNLVKHRAAIELEFSQAISKMENKMQEYRTQSRENWAMSATAMENANAMNAMSSVFSPLSAPDKGLLAVPRASPIGPLVPGVVPLGLSTTTSTPPGFGPITSAPFAPASYAVPGRERSSSMFSNETTPNYVDLLSTERSALSSLNTFGGLGNGVFGEGLKRTRSQNRNSIGGSVGPLNPAPGFERFGGGAPSKGSPGSNSGPSIVGPGRLSGFGGPQ